MTEARRQKLKERIIIELGTTPIIEAACRKAGIARATYYRWLEEDDTFYSDAELAQAQGRERVSDMAESEIMKGIGRGDFRYVKYWLGHNNERYVRKQQPAKPYRRVLFPFRNRGG